MRKSMIAVLMACAVSASACGDDDYSKSVRTPVDADELVQIVTESFFQSDRFPALVARCEKVLDAAYMAGTLIEESTTYPGYEGLPLKLYEYQTGTDKSAGIRKTGRVWMLNPSAEQMAKWVATACCRARKKILESDLETVCNQILVQSGGQFPVCGIVYEDMDGTGYYPYAFKDGVTVYVADRDKWATGTVYGEKTNYTCSPEQLDYCCQLTDAQLRDYTGTYARICSTTREHYAAYDGSVDVGTSESQATRKVAWLGVVRDLYKKAWNSSENELISAWAVANLK